MTLTGALTNSGVSRRSEIAGIGEITAVVACLATLISLCGWWLYGQDYLLYYGDAQAHLNISRSLFDSKTPGYEQLGTVWLPILHIICLPFVKNDWLWSTGLAGTIPVAVCFVVTGTFLYMAALEAYESRASAMVVLACFASNPNLLYLSAIPMTETVFLAGLAMLLFAACRNEARPKQRWTALGIIACWLTSLTRYDGWFLIPFAAAWFALNSNHKISKFVTFSATAALAPVYWFAHNWWETGNALDFYNGPYAPRAIQGGKPYPGYHDLAEALRYYFTAGRVCSGWTLLILGIAGSYFALRTKARVPAFFLLLTPAFYVLSMYSSGGSPIYVPQLWPSSYYNTRYGIAVTVFAAFAAGGLFSAFPARWQRCAFAVPFLAVLPWLLHPAPENWVCWKESEVNSRARRVWTGGAAEYVRAHYQTGQGITASFGDLTGIFCRARIPLREVLHEGNGPAWFAASRRPDLFHPSLWWVSMGDLSSEPVYDPVQHLIAGGNSKVTIQRRR